jgi:YidC/Oxa1 family membrane protein insertase
MDRNQLIGLILISAMLVGYLYFFSDEPQVEEQAVEQTEDTLTANQESQQKEPAEATNTITATDSTEIIPDSLKNQQELSKWGPLYGLNRGEISDYVIENDLVRITVSGQGASLKEVMLKKHKTWTKEPLVLLNSDNHNINWIVPTRTGSFIDLSELVYEGEISGEGEDKTLLELKARNESGTISHIFTISKGSHIVDYQVFIEGFSDFIANQNITLKWKEDLLRYERVLEQSRNHTAVNYYDTKGDFNDVSNDADPEQVSDSNVKDIRWFSMKQKFFNSGFISSLPMTNGTFTSSFDERDSSIVKTQTASVEIPFQAFSDKSKNFQFYFGPNNFSILKNVTDGYGENVYLGWTIFASVNKYTIVPFFNFLERYIANYGLLILILVLVVKLILSPLSYRSYVSMAKMKVLRPEIEEIKNKLGDDQQKVQMETMQLYQKFGVNPLSGCVPMVLQIPVLFALFNFFPNSVELRQKSFLWADDLSTYDSILDLPFSIPFYGDHVSLFTLLMTLSTLGYTYVQNQNNPMQQQGPMKTMQYFFPLMIMFFLNNFSSGLTYYYFLSNVITIGQQLLIARFIDDKAIRSKLETRKQKRSGKKKSGFASRLEEAMKAQQDQQKSRQKTRKKK